MPEQSTGALKGPWRIGVDVGGTFTDLVIADAAGGVWSFKASTTPANPAEGVLAVIGMAAIALDSSFGEILGGCRIFVHGSTIATNTILERKGARVGLLVTEGFRDTLEIRRGGMKEDAWDHRRAFPEVLVPRHLRLPVVERMDKDGRVIRRLEPASVMHAIDTFRHRGVTSIAICFLNSYRNADHERSCADLIRKKWPHVWLSVSADIAPVIGEYERTSTTVLNAYVTPRVVPYLRQLEEDLRTRGLKHPLLIIQSNGGAASVAQLADRAVTLALSGPAAGASALRAVSEMSGLPDLLLMEIGGTSCDVMLMDGGEIGIVDAVSLNDYHLTLPSVDIHSASAGGGTIATVDDAGLLHVGPQGAGARPGPACYGYGGEQATVTDAHVVLGRLRSGGFANGLIALREDLAHSAIEHRIAAPLRVDVVTAASGIIRLLEQSLCHAIERVSVERGHDPRRFTLVAGGGAGALHAMAVAKALGCATVHVPRMAGVLCAFGMCSTDIRQDFRQTWLGPLAESETRNIAQGFRHLDARAREWLAHSGFDLSDTAIEYGMDLRYGGQQWPVQVPAPSIDIAVIRADFEARHKRQFGHHQPDGAIEVVSLRLAGIGRLTRIPPRWRALAAAIPIARERRRVYLDERAGFETIPVYNGRGLHAGQTLAGPALIEERSTSILIGRGDLVAVDASDNYVISVGCA